jgi:hypothetical protein
MERIEPDAERGRNHALEHHEFCVGSSPFNPYLPLLTASPGSGCTAGPYVRNTRTNRWRDTQTDLTDRNGQPRWGSPPFVSVFVRLCPYLSC